MEAEKKLLIEQKYNVEIPIKLAMYIRKYYHWNKESNSFLHIKKKNVEIFNIDREEVEILYNAVDANYWDTWEDVLSNFVLDDEGIEWMLWYDGDLFLVNEKWLELEGYY